LSREYPLDGFAPEIRENWRKYRPQMYRQLEQAGNLDQALHEASERTGEAFASLVEDGTEPIQAWEAVREEWAFLPGPLEVEDSTGPACSRVAIQDGVGEVPRHIARLISRRAPRRDGRRLAPPSV
jgi:hypothetical protein